MPERQEDIQYSLGPQVDDLWIDVAAAQRWSAATENQQSRQICAKASSPGCVISASLGGQWDGFAPNGHLEWNSLVWQTAGPRHHGRGVKSLRYRKPTLWQGLYSGSYNVDANCCNIEMTLCLSQLPQHSILPPVSR